MKVEINGIEEAEDFTSFTGLVMDRDRDVWIFLEEKCFWASEEADLCLHDKKKQLSRTTAHSPYSRVR